MLEAQKSRHWELSMMIHSEIQTDGAPPWIDLGHQLKIAIRQERNQHCSETHLQASAGALIYFPLQGASHRQTVQSQPKIYRSRGNTTDPLPRTPYLP